MQAARNDPRKEFEAAYDEFLQPLYRFFFYRFGDRDRAKDLAQETFMRAWLYVRQGNEITSMKPFLYTTASNLFKNELRGKKPVVSLDALMTDTFFEIASDDTSPEEHAEARLLMEKLPQLHEKHQEVLRLRYVDGLPPREIAAVLGESVTAVSVRIHRALRHLRELHEKT